MDSGIKSMGGMDEDCLGSGSTHSTGGLGVILAGISMESVEQASS